MSIQYSTVSPRGPNTTFFFIGNMSWTHNLKVATVSIFHCAMGLCHRDSTLSIYKYPGILWAHLGQHGVYTNAKLAHADTWKLITQFPHM